jgi:hypothetical protein
MLEWLPWLRLKGSALPLSGSFGSVSLGTFLTFCIKGANARGREKGLYWSEDLTGLNKQQCDSGGSFVGTSGAGRFAHLVLYLDEDHDADGNEDERDNNAHEDSEHGRYLQEDPRRRWEWKF